MALGICASLVYTEAVCSSETLAPSCHSSSIMTYSITVRYKMWHITNTTLSTPPSVWVVSDTNSNPTAVNRWNGSSSGFKHLVTCYSGPSFTYRLSKPKIARGQTPTHKTRLVRLSF